MNTMNAMNAINDNERSIYIESSQEAAADKAVTLIESIISQTLADRDVCNVALAGGTTPIPVYQNLANNAMSGKIPWEKLNFFFSDERNVPHDDVESNYGMVQRELFDKAPIDWSKVFPMPCDAQDLTQAALDYEQTICRVLGGDSKDIPRFDLLMLGVGYDGHVASLFPDSPMLRENKKLVAADIVPIIGRYRMSFTFPLIRAARNVILLVTGDDKADIVKRAIIKKDKSLPAMHVKPDDGKLFIVLDHSAGRLAMDELQEKLA